MNNKINLCILNITSWYRLSIGATHYYEKLYFCKNKNINLNNLTEYGKSCYGDYIELKRKLTKEQAIKLDQKDRTGGIYLSLFNDGKCLTDRFDSVDEIAKEALKIYKKKNMYL